MADTDIRTWASALSAPVSLTLYTTGTPASDEMERLGRMLADTAGGALRLSIKKGEAPLPFFETERGLKLYARPDGKLLGLLLYALAGEPDPIHEGLAASLQRLALPATLDLFVAEFCPLCPRIARQLITLALLTPRIRLSLFDGPLFPEEAERRGVQAAPTLIYDDAVRWSGQFDLTSAMEVVAGRPPEELSPEALRAMLEEGGASAIAAMVAEAGKPFASLTTLLAHEKWPVRLGAMVVMETLAETHPAIVSQTASALLADHAILSPAALGDIVYVAGLSGDPIHATALGKILEGPCDDALREALTEALATLHGLPPL